MQGFLSNHRCKNKNKNFNCFKCFLENENREKIITITQEIPSQKYTGSQYYVSHSVLLIIQIFI